MKISKNTQSRIHSQLLPTGCACVILLMVGGTLIGGDWKYVVPQQKETTFPPVFRAVFLLKDKPLELKETVTYRGKDQKYARIRYGSSDSVRVTVILDEYETGKADVYVDANRNRIIEAKDKLQGEGSRWEIPLDVAIVNDDTVIDSYRRTVVFQLGSTGRTILFATRGYMRGNVTINGKELPSRRMDGDGNGTFADLEDRLWIDKDGDGKWNAFQEQFLFAPILRIDGKRFAARSDALGHRLTMKKLDAVGKVRLAFSNKKTTEATKQIAVTLVGRDGTAVPITGLEKDVEVPAGEYRLNTVFLTLKDANSKHTCNFLFSSSSDFHGKRPWHHVKKGETLTLDPIGKLNLRCYLEGKKKRARPGEELTVNTLLLTGDGLLINTCYQGSENIDENHAKAIVVLRSNQGKKLGNYTCGFS